ncbi:hypothetical protein Tco_1346860 [Tanacetum coccineum]
MSKSLRYSSLDLSSTSSSEFSWKSCITLLEKNAIEIAVLEGVVMRAFLVSEYLLWIRIHKENGWAYTGCKKYNKKVNVVESKASSSSGKSKVTFYCEDHGVVQFASRYKLSGHTAWELMERHGMDVDEYWPGELLDLVDVDEGFTTPASLIKSTNLNDPSLDHVLDMQTLSSGMKASGSGQSSSSKRVFIDLDDIESEVDEGGSSSKTPKLVSVMVEKEDP